jgi:hypothetical protein
VKIRTTILALVGNLDLIHDLYFRGAVVASRYQVETRFYAPPHALGPWRRLGFPLSIAILITGLTVLSIH